MISEEGKIPSEICTHLFVFIFKKEIETVLGSKDAKIH